MDDTSSATARASHDASAAHLHEGLPVAPGTTAAVSRPESVNNEKQATMIEAETDIAEKHGETEEDEAHYPRGLTLWLISLALALAVFLVALVSIKSLRVFFRASRPNGTTRLRPSVS